MRQVTPQCWQHAQHGISLPVTRIAVDVHGRQLMTFTVLADQGVTVQVHNEPVCSRQTPVPFT